MIKYIELTRAEALQGNLQEAQYYKVTSLGNADLVSFTAFGVSKNNTGAIQLCPLGVGEFSNRYAWVTYDITANTYTEASGGSDLMIQVSAASEITSLEPLLLGTQIKFYTAGVFAPYTSASFFVFSMTETTLSGMGGLIFGSAYNSSGEYLGRAFSNDLDGQFLYPIDNASFTVDDAQDFQSSGGGYIFDNYPIGTPIKIVSGTTVLPASIDYILGRLVWDGTHMVVGRACDIYLTGGATISGYYDLTSNLAAWDYMDLTIDEVYNGNYLFVKNNHYRINNLGGTTFPTIVGGGIQIDNVVVIADINSDAGNYFLPLECTITESGAKFYQLKDFYYDIASNNFSATLTYQFIVSQTGTNAPTIDSWLEYPVYRNGYSPSSTLNVITTYNNVGDYFFDIGFLPNELSVISFNGSFDPNILFSGNNAGGGVVQFQTYNVGVPSDNLLLGNIMTLIVKI